MKYFNYHGKIKNLIKKGHCIKFEFVDNWNNIKPALVLYFDNDRPMPVREERWNEYLILLETHVKTTI